MAYIAIATVVSGFPGQPKNFYLIFNEYAVISEFAFETTLQLPMEPVAPGTSHMRLVGHLRRCHVSSTHAIWIKDMSHLAKPTGSGDTNTRYVTCRHRKFQKLLLLLL